MAFDELLTTQVRRKLTGLRSLLRAHLAGRGLCWVVLALVVAVFFTLGVDYLLRMDRAQRILMSTVSLAGIAFICWRFLLRPLSVPMGTEDLALVLEEHYPELDDRLISALQFSGQDPALTGASEAMIRKVAEQANAVAGELDPARTVASAGTWKRMGWPGIAVAVLAVITVLNPDIMGLWFKRNVLFGNERWPQETYLQVHGGPNFKVIRGGTLTLTVTATEKSKVVPAQVTFHMDFPSLPGEVKESVHPNRPGGSVFVKKIENVAEGFEFYVTGGDDRTAEFTVTVVRPPELIDLAGEKYYPDYMNRPPGAFKPEHGLIAVPAGSRLHFSGLADKDLSSARLLLDGEPAAELTIMPVTSDVDLSIKGRMRGIKGVLRLPQRVGKMSMVLAFELTDVDGNTNPSGAAYSLRIDPDRPPGVSMTRRGVRGEVSVRAMIPTTVQSRDDCGVARLGVSTQRVRGVEGTTLPAPVEAEITGFKAGDRDVRADHIVDLQPMKLAIGDRIRLQAVARDTLPGSYDGPNVAHSVVQTFKIVPDEIIQEELVRRQRELAQEFARAVVMQAGVRDRMRAVSDRLATARPDVETRRQLQTDAKNQRRVAAQTAIAVQQLQDVRDEMHYNRVDKVGEEATLGRIIEELTEFSKNLMPAIATSMETASNNKERAVVRAYAVDTAGRLDTLHSKLEEILKRLVKEINRQELAYRLKVVIDITEEIQKAIEEMIKNRTGTVIEDDTNP